MLILVKGIRGVVGKEEEACLTPPGAQENVLWLELFPASETLNQQVQIGRSSLKAAHLNDDTKEVAGLCGILLNRASNSVTYRRLAACWKENRRGGGVEEVEVREVKQTTLPIVILLSFLLKIIFFFLSPFAYNNVLEKSK